MRRIKKTGRPLVLTVKGKAEAVLLDAAAYQDVADHLDAVARIRRGLAQAKKGVGRPVDEVVWELSVKRLDAERCELTNHVIGKTTPAYWEFLGREGVPFELARKAQDVASSAHNAQETPLFAKSIEKKALSKRLKAM
jgi:hypothetical protein